MRHGILLIIFLHMFLLTAGIQTNKSINVDYTYVTDYLEKQKLELLLQENNDFKTALGLQESGLNPTSVNKIGAMGVWQFMPYTLKDLGYNISPDKFRKDPSIFPYETQKEALQKKIVSDIKQLRNQWFRPDSANINYIRKYVGTTVNGVDVTLSGIVAACHIGGVYGTMRFFDTGGMYDPSDCFGTGISDYLVKFSKYKFHEEDKLIDRLTCLEIRLKEQSKSYTMAPSLNATEIVSTLGYPKGFSPVETLYNYNSYRLEYKCSCLNTTELFYCSEVGQQLSMGTLPETVLERLSGTIRKSGKGWYIPHHHPCRQNQGIDYSNSISNRYGMLRFTSNCYISFHPLSLKRLTALRLREVVSDILADRKKYFY